MPNTENTPASEEAIGSPAYTPPLLSLPGLTLEATAPVFAILDNWRVSCIILALLDQVILDSDDSGWISVHV